MVFYAFIILVFILLGRPQDFYPFLKPYRLALLFSIVTFVLTVISKSDASFWKILNIKESKRYLLFFFIMVIGIPFAYHRAIAFNYIFFKYLANMLFFFLLLIHLKSIEKLKMTLSVICISTLFTAWMSLVQGTFYVGRFYPGTMYDPNDLAYFLVSLFLLFFFFTQKTEWLMKRILALTGIFISIVVIFFTGSKGGFLGLIIVLFFIIFSKIVIEKSAIKLLFLMFFVLALFLNVDKINIDRFKSLTDISSDYNVTSETGRLKIWQKGLRVTASNPITGVGVRSFGRAIGYQRKAEGEIPKWQSPHSSYIQILAETGIIGFLVFISLIVTCLKNFHYLSRDKLIAGCTPHPYTYIAGLLKVGFTGSLICAFFLAQAYSTIFTLYFALSAVLRHLSDEEREKST